MEFRLQAEYFVAEPFRLKAELHAYLVFFVIFLLSSSYCEKETLIPVLLT